MLVTLNTDGSLGEGNKAGYAYWISSNEGRFKSYGRPPNCDNAMAPELVAIAKGLHFIRNHPELKKATKVIINTDCVPAIRWIKSINIHKKKHRKHKGSLQNVARHHIWKICKKEYNGLPTLKTEYRHVKAHTSDLSKPRSWVNDWLDKKAKEARSLEIGEQKFIN